MERRKLEDAEIAERLSGLNGWSADGGLLRKKFTFPNFAEALNFVNRVGDRAEAADHHPDINFGWGYAEFEITTHDRGGLTDFDFALAREIDALATVS
jgi:4a-hydroxytetrahydrobiopterin dehydratase